MSVTHVAVTSAPPEDLTPADWNAAHLGTNAHDHTDAASGGVLAAADIPFTPVGTIAATNVQAAIAEAASEGGGGGGAPTTADYLVGTAQGGLSAEIVVGATPGGELGGTWASPTVDVSHTGSTHAATQAAAEATAAAALSAHLADTTDAHDASAISFDDTGLTINAANVQTGLQALDAAISAGGIPGTIVNAKGDLIVATADDTVVRLPVGTNTHVLTADSGETTGLKWALASGGSSFKHAISTAAGADQSYSTSWADLFPTQLTTVIAAAAGNILEMTLTLTHNDTDGQSCQADFHIGATTNARIGDATKGSYLFFHQDANGEFFSHTIVAYRVVVANDISGGNVTIKPQVQSSVNANPDIFYNTPPVVFVVKNLGAEAA